MCGSSMLSCSLLLAAYECGNTSAAAVYDVSLTTVDIKSLLPCITLVCSSDGLLALCLSLSVCFCVLAIMTQCSNVKSQPQWNVWFATSQLDSTHNHRYTTINCVRFNISYMIRMATYSLYKSIINKITLACIYKTFFNILY